MDTASILIFIILIGLSAFFSGSELALMTVPKHAIASLVREGRFGAKSLEKIRENTDQLLTTILIGNNIVNVLSASFATAVTLQLARTSNLSEATAVSIATAAVTVFLLLFGEITPKTVCARYNVPISLVVAPFYRFLMIVLYPLTLITEYFLKGMLWIFWMKDVPKKISYQEVEAFIDMSHEEWEVEDDERKQIKNILGLRDMFAESVMTPRVNVAFLSIEMSVNEACQFFLKKSHSRMPVAWESNDDVDYILTFREAFRLQAEWFGEKKLSELSLEKIMKIPLTQTLDDLFEQFQKSRRHMALVFDEFGGTAGIVTMEDILEEVFGDIKDETDREEIFMRKKGNGKIEAVWSLLIDDILEEINLRYDELSIPEEYLWETLSYIILSEFEWFPSEWEEIIFESEQEKLILKVLETEDNVIEKVECELVIKDMKK